MYYCFNPLVSNIFKYHSNRLCSWNYTFACFVFLVISTIERKNASYKKELCILLQSSFYKHFLFVKNCFGFERIVVFAGLTLSEVVSFPSGIELNQISAVKGSLE